VAVGRLCNGYVTAIYSIRKHPGFYGLVCCQDVYKCFIWLGWAYLTKKMPHAATTPIATAFKICINHRKNGLLNRLPTKVGFSISD
jgi:hypothetical protein